MQSKKELEKEWELKSKKLCTRCMSVRTAYSGAGGITACNFVDPYTLLQCFAELLECCFNLSASLEFCFKVLYI
jgi:hypothetical protein